VSIIEKRMAELRRLCDRSTWPKEYMILDGDLFWYRPSGDPLEECVDRALRNGRFQ